MSLCLENETTPFLFCFVGFGHGFSGRSMGCVIYCTRRFGPGVEDFISSLAVCTMCVCVAFGRVGMVCCSGGVWIQREDAWTNLC